MSSGDVSHPISSSPTRPCGLAGRAHSRTPHAAHPGSHTWDRHKSLSTRSSTQPAHTTDTRGMGLNTYFMNTPEAHMLVHSQPRPLVCTHTCTYVRNQHTQSHMGVLCPWADPTHCSIRQLVVCLPSLVTGSGSRPQGTSHTQMVPELGQEHMPTNWLGLLSPKCPRFRLTERRPDPRPCRSS